MLLHICVLMIWRKDMIASKMGMEEALTQLPDTFLTICLGKQPIEIDH